MNTTQCSSCGGFCGKRCQRENINMEKFVGSGAPVIPDTTSAYQRGYLDGIGRDCPHCRDYKAMYLKVRDELAAEQQVTERQTVRIVGLRDEIRNLTGED